MPKTYHNGKFSASTLPRRYFTHAGKLPRIGVMTVDETRLTNARLLISECGGLDDFGYRIAMNNENGQLSNYFGKNPKKKIGSKIARRIEAAFKRPKGWLDSPQTNIQGKPESPSTSEIGRLGQDIDQIRITLLAFLDVLTEMTPGAASALLDRLELAVAPEYAAKGFHARVLSTLRNRLEKQGAAQVEFPPRASRAPSGRKPSS